MSAVNIKQLIDSASRQVMYVSMSLEHFPLGNPYVQVTANQVNRALLNEVLAKIAEIQDELSKS